MTAARDNAGKPELDYLLEFPTAITAFARVKEIGAAKYDRGNWRKGGKPDREYTAACLRHLMAFANGEYYAPDTGCPHLAHAVWNLFALMELNYSEFIVDVELFDKAMAYWNEKDKKVPTPEPVPHHEQSGDYRDPMPQFPHCEQSDDYRGPMPQSPPLVDRYLNGDSSPHHLTNDSPHLVRPLIDRIMKAVSDWEARQ